MNSLAHPTGGYLYLGGINAYSSGVRAADGMEVVHVRFRAPLPYVEGFTRALEWVQRQGRPASALCSVELRSPAPFTRQGFLDFNLEYCGHLQKWGLLLEDGVNAIARTNVAPTTHAPEEVVLYGFGCTVPSSDPPPTAEPLPTFIIAGAGELRGGPLLDAAVIAPGDRTPAGLRQKAAYVMDAMEKRLTGLGLSWQQVTSVDVYTAEPMDQVLPEAVIPRLGPGSLHGLTVYPTRPPINELDFEMDTRGVFREFWI